MSFRTKEVNLADREKYGNTKTNTEKELLP